MAKIGVSLTFHDGEGQSFNARAVIDAPDDIRWDGVNIYQDDCIVVRIDGAMGVFILDGKRFHDHDNFANVGTIPCSLN